MYNNRFILAIKHNNKVLRENKNVVQLPFNSEYSLLLKNENYRRAIVNIKIDSKDVLNGNGIILNANSELNLERFLEKNDSGRRFKFVDLSHGGIFDKKNPENGLIEVDFWLEENPVLTTWSVTNIDPFWEKLKKTDYDKEYKYPIITCQSANLDNFSTKKFTSYSMNMINTNAAVSNDIGGTVKGSKSNQRFENVNFGNKDLASHTQIRLWLRATKEPQYVEDTKIKFCTQCGKKLQFKDNFCSSCGKDVKNN